METFQSFTGQHYWPIIIYLALTGMLIWIGKNSKTFREKKGIAFIIALSAWLIMFAGTMIKIADGSYTLQEDLPLFMCRLVAWLLPIVIYVDYRKGLKVMYFWVLSGTLQAILTPDVKTVFPSFEYIRYFVLHMGLISAVIFIVVVYPLRITWKDCWTSFLYAQPYLLFLMAVNLLLGSNYGYTQHKPPGGSVLDFFGPWPFYILGAELIMFVMFMVLMIPFIRFRNQQGLRTTL